MSSMTKSYIVIADIILFVLLLSFLPFSDTENKGLAMLVFVAVLWLSEAVHVTITAITIPVLAAILGLVPTAKALNGFSDSNIYLFFGGFALAAAMHVQKLDKLIAQRIMAMARGSFFMSVILLFTITAFLSMWMSNTATAAMMLPLAIGMLANVDAKENRNVFVFVLLGIAFSASIGGMGTLVGSPPNAIVASNIGMTFADWFVIGFPFMVVLMPVMILTLYFVFKPNLKIEVNFQEENIELTPKRITTLAVFVIVALCWIFSAKINPALSGMLGLAESIGAFDSVIAIAAAIIVVVLKLISWKEVQDNTDWGVLMLFGGGITLSAVLKDSGASKIMADGIVFMVEGSHYFVLGLLVAFFIVFLTEFTSNTASAALLVPLFISIAESIGAPPLGLALIIGLGASCAFMLPVATPPNAIVFGTGYIKQQEMVRVGLVLNVICSFVIATGAYFFFL
ncbi:Na(+)/dicarboxylate symporter [Anaerobiospirillum thomasii]|uniref:Na(+)/dicarboxylate symporter n=1 Tax=Anaerobiospirillum thomasii TaxID=179995 RepID=A0A2X0VK43_9GAMM|nr:DASS family sodium-coupled anion symporter [Anaerobiospirillum thomasii]SPT69838.1 Na(+)/dicarboxylate symporter [Anaerobiospirillum thomasii]SPT71495.1 Na(+)/dicarboxylate symporter [Anaerobiospirillum thomasii]